MSDESEINSPNPIQLRPRKWNILTWALFLLWLLFAIRENLPIKPEIAQAPPTPIATPIPLSHSILIGWPFTHIEYYQYPPNNAWARQTSLPGILINLGLIALVQFSIVAGVQRWFPTFRLRSLFFLTGIIAVVLMLFRWSLTSGNFHLLFLTLYLVYFTPLLLWPLGILLSKYRLATIDAAP